MEVKTEARNGFSAEIRIVPGWAWALAGVAFIAAQWYFNFALGRELHAPPLWARPLLGVLAGLGAGCYLLFIGYINRDAKRRGMNAVLWTVVAVLIPNCLGILLYFVLRQPQSSACPQCGNSVQTGFNYCPRCSYKISPSCPQCQRVVGVNDAFCPYCAASLRNQAPPAPGLATKLPG